MAEAQTAQLAVRYLGGASLSVLAGSSGHSARWVARRLRAAGVQIRPAGRQQQASRRLDAAQLRAWYLEAGMSLRAIAVLTGVSPSTVQTALHACGIPARRPGRTPGPPGGRVGSAPVRKTVDEPGGNVRE